MRWVPRWASRISKDPGTAVQGVWRAPAPEGLGSQCRLCPGKALGRPGARCAGGGSHEGLRVQGAAGAGWEAQGSAQCGEAEEGPGRSGQDPCVTPAYPGLSRPCLPISNTGCWEKPAFLPVPLEVPRGPPGELAMTHILGPSPAPCAGADMKTVPQR